MDKNNFSQSINSAISAVAVTNLDCNKHFDIF